MKKLLYILTFLLSGVAFGQSPDCRFNIMIKNVNIDKYDYKVVLLTQNDKPDFQTIREYLKNYGWDNDLYSLLNFSNRFEYLKSEKGNGILNISWLDGNSSMETVRVMVIRKKKETDKMEMMYVDISGEPICGIDIEFKKFKKGKRKSETFIPETRYYGYQRIELVK